MHFQEFFQAFGGEESGVEQVGSGEEGLEEVGERQVGEDFDAEAERIGKHS